MSVANLLKELDNVVRETLVSGRIIVGSTYDLSWALMFGLVRCQALGWDFLLTNRSPKNSKVASYSGKIVSACEAKDSQYAVAWSSGKVVNAKSTQNSVGRYANTCRGADKKRKKCKGNNVKLARDFARKRISLKATKKIKRGDEIFNTYGASFRVVR